MFHHSRRSGLSLVLFGIAGLIFFWVTDARWGLAQRWNQGENVVDLAHQHAPGTIVGFIASVLLLAAGIWLMKRRAW